jgi:hypothetical protein
VRRGHVTLPIFLTVGRGGWHAPPFWPDFLVAVARHIARTRHRKSPLAATPRLKFGRILGPEKLRYEAKAALAVWGTKRARPVGRREGREPGATREARLGALPRPHGTRPPGLGPLPNGTSFVPQTRGRGSSKDDPARWTLLLELGWLAPDKALHSHGEKLLA